MLLLQHNADVCVTNGEGKRPRDMTQSSESGREIAKLLRAAEETEALRKEAKLLSAAREGNIIELNKLVSILSDIICFIFFFCGNSHSVSIFLVGFSAKRYSTSAKYQLCR